MAIRWHKSKSVKLGDHPALAGLVGMVGVDEETGDVYLAAGTTFVAAVKTSLLAAMDGVAFVMHLGFPYVPTSWVPRRFPATRETAEALAGSVREQVGWKDGIRS